MADYFAFPLLITGKNKNVWGIPSMEKYLASIMIRKKRHL
jgi:hypothetical protein